MQYIFLEQNMDDTFFQKLGRKIVTIEKVSNEMNFLRQSVTEFNCAFCM